MNAAFVRATFGSTGRRVLRLGFGGMGLGNHFGPQDPARMVEVVHTALRRGVDFIDTARAYGASERIIGEALRRWDGPPPFIATKALPIPPPADAPPGAGWQTPLDRAQTYPRGALRESLLASLQQLGVARVDLLQLHQYWAHWDDDWRAEVAELRDEGLIGHVGISVPDHRHDLALPLVQSGAIAAVQTIVNIFDPLAADCLLPLCASRGVAVIARCILDEGGLAGAIGPATRIPRDAWLHGYFDCVPRELYVQRIERLRRFVPTVARSLAELAIRYVLSFPGVSVALTSMHAPEHLEANLRALEAGPLPPEVFDELRYRERWIRNFYQARRYVDAP